MCILDHIGVGKDSYSCEWGECSRKGQRQATRHSLITHCRAHTGERPYTCTIPCNSPSFSLAQWHVQLMGTDLLVYLVEKRLHDPML